ncbi:MAG TPA: ribose-phosphate pyrophosphokinase-like domain-containing protein, partial [Deinococcales bacterium]|nr:ribose-phosphate pyrophosphokinase-like domain-containing protein [Deinococcales bacterium]
MSDRPLKVFAGQSNKELAREICEYLGVPLGHSELARFSNDNLQVRFSESLRESDVFLVQSLTDPVSDNLMELFL